MAISSMQDQKGSKVARISAFISGVVCYGIFLCTFFYAVGFLGNFIVPRSIDSAANPTLLLLAAYGNRSLECAKSLGSGDLVFSICLWLATGIGIDFFDRPL